ncbi:hypothetical protein B4155_5022 [Bacillus cereus]|nr:hypothetical protein BMB171_C0805 [Bacillus thuringiensis BMB171]EEL12919.1 hypothetical protein bcere0015_7860 [Bacillus cereus BDRD-Cer4]KZD74533.1 hypothetical protein B4155_5022 [Bacillus cereus]
MVLIPFYLASNHLNCCLSLANHISSGNSSDLIIKPAFLKSGYCVPNFIGTSGIKPFSIATCLIIAFWGAVNFSPPLIYLHFHGLLEFTTAALYSNSKSRYFPSTASSKIFIYSSTSYKFSIKSDTIAISSCKRILNPLNGSHQNSCELSLHPSSYLNTFRFFCNDYC